MPASGFIAAADGRPLTTSTPRGLATRVYSPYGADWLRHGCRRLAQGRGA
jgi:hypothetical protein